MPFVIRPETVDDMDAIERVNRLAFARDDEAQLVDALRRGGFIRLSLVVEQGEQIVGHIAFSALAIVTDHERIASLALAPLAVTPEFQRRGIGTALVQRGLDLCREQRHRSVVVLGNPEFYRRFGFSAERARPLRAPFSGAAWMATELASGALHGVAGRVEYPAPFGVL